MSETRTLILGFVAGVTILLGLPLGRLRRPMPGVRQLLNATAVGILIFLVWDVLAHAWEPIDTALGKVHDHSGGLGPVFGYGALFLGGLSVGLLGLLAYERALAGRSDRPRPADAGPQTRRFGPGAMAAEELTSLNPPVQPGTSPARRLALTIAVGIGLHNFGEGLAIGGSAGRGEIALATLLVIGFALHNATEGFGIVAPLASEADRPSWSFLLLGGLIGGGPTVVGTAIGRQFTSDALSVIFLSLAAGSILYVVVQLIAVASRAGRRDLLYVGILAGLAAGFLTDAVVTAGGA
ncbi:ZIP family metal transporter [Frankia sp. AgB1.9]|uniref:ZIP family metal transporter n=1 Tax=unclassified Frankia TaxID=2632575 RepID=UPI00193308EE|nr:MULTISPECIES: ZIP family metal transporter [unclassified Frankia]MBL7489928.1 ZIP family metal transporter [Frankia sp. AgW1.1]MBL7552659.1 ZIP family metal transporter [Frankia sp. AgB1.9]MBL7623824.1 ZIP family metal transporter [Frankia sp. AgB1.8]